MQDEEALLLAELERIKKEREAEARKKAEEEAARWAEGWHEVFGAGPRACLHVPTHCPVPLAGPWVGVHLCSCVPYGLAAQVLVECPAP